MTPFEAVMARVDRAIEEVDTLKNRLVEVKEALVLADAAAKKTEPDQK